MLEKKTIDEALNALNDLREKTGEHQTVGLSLDRIRDLVRKHPDLVAAIQKAKKAYDELSEDEKDLLSGPEEEACKVVQEDYVNFYPETGINPYVPLSARGPWIVTCYGAVVHDTGGYGMMGMGHNPPEVLEVLGNPHVMANVMTPSINQRRFAKLLKKEIGYSRKGCPFERFICLNSGSESVSLTARIADIHARNETKEGAKYFGKEVRMLALRGGFHGRTDRPAVLSQATRDAYEKSLASFEDDQGVDFFPVNDVDAIQRIFDSAKEKNIFYNACYIEPVMGEGISGLAVTKEFYQKMREVTAENSTLLIVDSIQAALRAQGCLSIVDYPGFQECEAPDMETYSKALNAGQYPLSVVALSSGAAETYKTGVYGNTMTTNPKALDVGSVVLESIDDELRRNIRDRGREFVEKLEELKKDYPGVVEDINGTGLLVCAELNPEKYTVNGEGGFEEYLRKNGIEMIHGGKNGLRFTPHFTITSDEIDMIISMVRKGLEEKA